MLYAFVHISQVAPWRPEQTEDQEPGAFQILEYFLRRAWSRHRRLAHGQHKLPQGVNLSVWRILTSQNFSQKRFLSWVLV